MTGSVDFDPIAARYDESRPLPNEVADRIADAITTAAPTGLLVELGVGTGRVALALNRRGRDVVGVDLSAGMLRRCRAKAEAESLPPPKLVRADITRLPLRSGSVDAIIEADVLHLVPDWHRAIAEGRRVLAPGGVLVTCGHQTGSVPRGPREWTRYRLRALLVAAGHRPPDAVGAHGADDIVAALRDIGGTVDDLPPIAWSAEESWRWALDLLDARSFSFTWRVPDDAFRAAVATLTDEVAARVPDPDRPVRVPRTWRLAAVRFR